MKLLYLKHLLIRTPLEGVAKKLQRYAQLGRVLRHPGMWEIYLEDGRIDAALGRLIKPDWNCIDIGAHLGSSLAHIVALAPRGQHMAIEPVPEKAAWLRRKFPEVEVKEIALSNQQGSVTFSENLSRPGFSGLHVDKGSGDKTYDITVQCDTLDRVVPRERRIGFIKIDVEGAELNALQGARELLARDTPAILFESAPGNAERFGVTRKDLYSFLVDEHDYSIYFLKDYLAGNAPASLPAFDAAHHYPFRAFNYLAISRKSLPH